MSRRPRLAVFCSGNGSNFEAILSAVRAGRLKADVAVMVCDNPKAFALRRAARRGVPVCVLSPKLFKKREDFERVIAGVLKSQDVDLVVLAGFMRILTPWFIRAFRGRIVNIHPSYLPAFKGAHAIRDAFDAEVATTGVTVHVVTNELDGGPVVEQVKVRVSRDETLSGLEKKIHAVEHRLYPAAIQKFLKRLNKR